MWGLIFCCAFLALSAAADVREAKFRPFAPFDAPFIPGHLIPILRQDQAINADGSYNWFYQTGNGISANEAGALTYQGSPEPSIAAAGSFSYTSPEGIPIAVTYTADENGFRPVGAHLPTPPPIPPAIAKALAWQAAHPHL